MDNHWLNAPGFISGLVLVLGCYRSMRLLTGMVYAVTS